MIAVPSNYSEWHACITINCGLKLTAASIELRLLQLKNAAIVIQNHLSSCMETNIGIG